MRKNLISFLLVLVMMLGAALPALAQVDDGGFNDGRLNPAPDAPVIVYCRYDGGLESFVATGGEGFSLSRTQIQGALAQAVLDDTSINVGFGGGGSQLIAFPDGGLLLAAGGYTFTIPATSCGGFEPDTRFVIRLVGDLVGIVDATVDGGEIVVNETTSTSTSYGVTYSNSTSVQNVDGQHVVQRGENLFRIGLRYGISYEDLAALNGITDPGQIYAGQVLKVPNG